MSDPSWRLEERNGVVIARCGALDVVDSVAHAFGTRRADGADAFDLGRSQDRTPEAVSRRARLAEAAGIAGADPVLPLQVHGTRLVEGASAAGAEADGAIFAWGDSRPVGVLTADCVPILLVDAGGEIAAAVHAGWRGTAAGIAERAVAALSARGVPPTRLIAALGPAIRGCCYEVGADVASAIAAGGSEPNRPSGRPGPGGGILVDLHRALRDRLEAVGVPSGSIHGAPWCSSCRKDLFFSFRRDGQAAGRQMTVVGANRSP